MIDQTPPAAQLEPVGRAGRKLLGLGLENPQYARFYLPVAIPAVCRTYALAPAESEDLIRLLIQSERLAQGNIEGLHWLTRSIEALIPIAPSLVEDIYRAIFDAPDMPDDQVPLYDSKILPLTTTLRQEFEGARHQLVGAFGDFLRVAPEHALRVLAHVVETYIKDKRGHEDEPPVFDIPFGDQVAQFAADASCFRDERRAYEHDPAMRMLKAFQEHLAATASHDDAPARLSAILRHIASHHRRAVVWRRLLMSAAEHPTTLGTLVTPLLKAPIVLITPDTYTGAGELLRAVYPHLDEAERRAIETVIMDLPGHPLLEEDVHRERKRARLLGCLPFDLVVTNAARELIADLNARNEIPANESAFAGDFEDLDPGDIHEMMWRHEGIPFDSPENVAFRSLRTPVSEFCTRFLNGEPSLAEAQAILPHVQQLQSAIADGPEKGVHERFLQDAFGTLASVCETLARNTQVLADSVARKTVTAVLLDASLHPVPRHSDESNEQFDRSPAWGGGSPRIEAAQGLLLLARVPEAITQPVLDAIERLSQDPVHAVRFMVAERLRCLYHTRFDDMWRYIDTMATSDQSNAVLVALTNQTLHPLIGKHLDRVVPLASGIFHRVDIVAEGRDPRAACLSIMVTAYLHANQPEASHFLLFTLAEDASQYVREMNYVIGDLRATLTLGPVNAPNEHAEAIRGRAWRLFNTICQSARAKWDDLQRQYGSTPTPQIPTEAMDLVQSLAELLDTVTSELRFASECHQEEEVGTGNDAARPRALARQRFWQESQVTLDSLESLGVVHAVHHLVEFLESYIDVAPEQVFIRLGRIIVAAEQGGYHLESMAADLVVKIIERYLAQFRQIFHTSDECRQLIVRILDIFVGWPQARRLAYRLEELYR